jgi:phosphonoacetate hydrolase
VRHHGALGRQAPKWTGRPSIGLASRIRPASRRSLSKLASAGVRLLERGGATLLYLSLSDFVQHAYAPGEPEANAFNQKVDQRVGSLVAAGAVVGIVADHGMNDKCRPNGTRSGYP